MTRKEKVEKAINGASWEEARDIGIGILKRCLAYDVHVKGCDPMTLMEDIVKASDKWVHEEGGSFVIAMAMVGQSQECEKDNKK